jgi:tetratricopeptide (TPR) repeat protein
MACKESMVTAPVMIALFDRVFLFASFRDAWRDRRRLYIGLASGWLLLAALLTAGPRPHSAGFSAGLSPWTYLLNQPAALLRYLELAIWPRSLVLLYGWPRPVTLAQVLPSAVVIVALLVLTAIALRVWPRAGFLGAWFWITLAPTSTIVPIATEVAAERRMYLPLAGLLLLIVVAMTWVWHWITVYIRNRGGVTQGRVVTVGALVPAVIVTGIATALTAATINRGREYATPVVMARTIVERYPTPVAHLGLGRALLAEGNRQEGLLQLQQALPGAPAAHVTLGLALLDDGRTDEAMAHLQAFVRDERPFLADVIIARAAIGQVFMARERWADAAQEFRTILETLPGNTVAERQLADAEFARGRWDEAGRHYQAYLLSEPRDAGALNNLGIALGSMGQVDGARSAFLGAVAADPDFAQAHHNLASVLLNDRDLDQAVAHAERAIALDPGNAESHELLGRILLKYGRVTDAAALLARALELNPASRLAREELRQLRGMTP